MTADVNMDMMRGVNMDLLGDQFSSCKLPISGKATLSEEVKHSQILILVFGSNLVRKKRFPGVYMIPLYDEEFQYE